jgi:hypothetical protein
MAEGEEEQRISKKFVCLGRRLYSDGKIRWLFQEYEETENFPITFRLIGEPWAFKEDKKIFRNCSYGLRYYIDATETSISFATQKYVGRWDNASDLLLWRIEDEKCDIKRRQEKLLDEGKEKLLDEGKENVDFASLANELRNIQKAYNTTDRLGKRTIELMVIDTLRKGQLL